MSSQATRTGSRRAARTCRVTTSRLPLGVGQTMRRRVTGTALRYGRIVIDADELAAFAAIPAPTGAEEPRLAWLEQRLAGAPGSRRPHTPGDRRPRLGGR